LRRAQRSSMPNWLNRKFLWLPPVMQEASARIGV
jgi:hypothetical protein